MSRSFHLVKIQRLLERINKNYIKKIKNSETFEYLLYFI